MIAIVNVQTVLLMKIARFLNVLRVTVVKENALSWQAKSLNLAFVQSKKWVSETRKFIMFSIMFIIHYVLKPMTFQCRSRPRLII